MVAEVAVGMELFILRSAMSGFGGLKFERVATMRCGGASGLRKISDPPCSANFLNLLLFLSIGSH